MNDLFVYWVNGLLITLYLILRLRYVLVGLSLALVLVLRYGVRPAAGAQPLRYERGTVGTLTTGFWAGRWLAVGCWTVGVLLAPTDIEGIWSLVMWAALLLALVAIPAEREALLFRHLWMMAVYGAGMVALRALIGATLSVGQMANLLHLSGDAQLLFTSVKASLLPYAGLIVWALYPVAYLGALFQRFQIVRGAQHAQGEPQTLIQGMLHRGEGTARTPRTPIPNDDPRSW